MVQIKLSYERSDVTNDVMVQIKAWPITCLFI